MRTHQPRKRFGQNFLHDPHVIAKIVHAINPQTAEQVVEIGPGLGAITEALLPYLNTLHVIEIDRDLIPGLQQLSQKTSNSLIVHQADALKFDFAALAHDKPLRIVGNLPYNISTPILFHLLQQIHCISDMHFMLQKEVVDRLAATPNNKTYGRLSVMVQYFCKVQALFDVSPGAFNPLPKVTSAIVRLQPYTSLPYPCNNFELFARMVRDAFNARRKTLRNALKNFSINWQSYATLTNLRPEQLSVADYVNLANHVSA